MNKQVRLIVVALIVIVLGAFLFVKYQESQAAQIVAKRETAMLGVCMIVFLDFKIDNGISDEGYRAACVTESELAAAAYPQEIDTCTAQTDNPTSFRECIEESVIVWETFALREAE